MYDKVQTLCVKASLIDKVCRMHNNVSYFENKPLVIRMSNVTLRYDLPESVVSEEREIVNKVLDEAFLEL
jgi:hypothetical protein